MTQNNLGNAFESMGQLGEAADSFGLALQVFTPETHPPHHRDVSHRLERVLEKQRAAQEIEEPAEGPA